MKQNELIEIKLENDKLRDKFKELLSSKELMKLHIKKATGGTVKENLKREGDLDDVIKKVGCVLINIFR